MHVQLVSVCQSTCSVSIPHESCRLVRVCDAAWDEEGQVFLLPEEQEEIEEEVHQVLLSSMPCTLICARLAAMTPAINFRSCVVCLCVCVDTVL